MSLESFKESVRQYRIGLTGLVSFFVVVLATWFIFYTIDIAQPEKHQYARNTCLIVIGGSYLIWFMLFLVSFGLLPKNDAGFLTHAKSNKEVERSYRVGLQRIRDSEQDDLENETDEILKTYVSEFKRFFAIIIASYFGHVATIILLGAAFTYMVVNTTNNPSSEIANLDKDFLSHIYFSTVTILTIGYGDIHPVSQLTRLCSIIQCFSILLLIMLGLSYLVSFEFNRVGNVRKAILSELRQALPKV